MLHTLLPPIERKALRFEYRLRALTVLFFSLSVACVVGIGALFPAFIKAATEQGNAANQLDEIKKAKDQSGLTAIQQQVAVGQKLLGVLSQNSAQTPLSALIQSLISERGQVEITSIAVTYTATTTAGATLKGNAPTREELIALKSRIENAQIGNKVTLPVSQLAKETNLPFSIDVTLKLP